MTPTDTPFSLTLPDEFAFITNPTNNNGETTSEDKNVAATSSSTVAIPLPDKLIDITDDDDIIKFDKCKASNSSGVAEESSFSRTAEVAVCFATTTGTSTSFSEYHPTVCTADSDSLLSSVGQGPLLADAAPVTPALDNSVPWMDSAVVPSDERYHQQRRPVTPTSSVGHNGSSSAHSSCPKSINSPSNSNRKSSSSGSGAETLSFEFFTVSSADTSIDSSGSSSRNSSSAANVLEPSDADVNIAEAALDGIDSRHISAASSSTSPTIVTTARRTRKCVSSSSVSSPSVPAPSSLSPSPKSPSPATLSDGRDDSCDVSSSRMDNLN